MLYSMGQIIRSLASVCLSVCVSVCHRSYGRNFEWNLMKLSTVVWGRKTKIEFVGGQNLPSTIVPPISPNFTILMHFQWDGLYTAVTTRVNRL